MSIRLKEFVKVGKGHNFIGYALPEIFWKKVKDEAYDYFNKNKIETALFPTDPDGTDYVCVKVKWGEDPSKKLDMLVSFIKDKIIEEQKEAFKMAHKYGLFEFSNLEGRD